MKLLFLLWILPVTFGDTSITCIYSEECTLPCMSIYSDVIHWEKDKALMHSFYYNDNQLEHQAKEYKGRTSLLTPAEIKQGNVSLRLKNIGLQDEGKYKCYTANDKNNIEKFVVVSVEAPVKSVNITLAKRTVTCSTSGVYPEPDIQWHSSNYFQEPFTTSHKTEENLFAVTSTIEMKSAEEAYAYNCSITSKDGKRILYKAVLENKGSPVKEFTFECPPKNGANYTISLRYSSIVLQYDSKTSRSHIEKKWKSKISFNPESGTVALSNLTRQQAGEYTWDCTTGHYRHILKTTLHSEAADIIGIIGGVLAAVIAIIVALLVIFKDKVKRTCCRGQKPGPLSKSEATADELQDLKTNGTKTHTKRENSSERKEH